MDKGAQTQRVRRRARGPRAGQWPSEGGPAPRGHAALHASWTSALGRGYAEDPTTDQSQCIPRNAGALLGAFPEDTVCQQSAFCPVSMWPN